MYIAMGKKLLFLVLLTFAFFLLNPFSGFGQSCSTKPTASISGTTTICAGTSATITFTATALTTVTYRINSGTNQTINIGSSGSNTLSATNLTTTTTFSLVNVQYTSGNCSIETPTGSATVTVNPNPTVNAGGTISAICQGGTTTSLGGSFGGGATSAVWSDGGAGGTFANNTGSFPNTTTYKASATSAASVTLTLTTAGGSCGTVSATKTLIVNPNPTVNAGGTISAICQGGTTAALAGSFGGGATSAIWSDGGAGGNFTNNIGSNPGNTTYTASASAPALITLTLTSAGGSCGTVNATKTLTINPNPTVSVGSSISSICQGGTTTALGGSFGGGATSAVWSDGGAGGSFTNNTGSNPGNTTYTASASAPASITLTLTSAGGSCGIISATKNLTVNPNPTVNAGGSIPAICQGGTTAALGGSFSGGATSAVWTANVTGGSFSNNSGSTPNIATYTAAANAPTTITLTLTTAGGSCGQVNATKTLTINPSATVSAGSNQTICSNSTAIMAGSFGGSATSASWKSSGSGSFNNNSTTAIYTPSNADINAGTVTLTYTTIDQSGICSPVESSMILTIKKAVEINSQPSNTAICASYSANLNVVASGDGLTYQWYKGTIGSGVAIVNSSNITGASSNILNFKQASTDDAGPYYAIVSGTSPCTEIITDQVTLKVDQSITITTQPITQTVCQGVTNLSFTVAANAGSDPLTYQWRKNGVAITDATAASYDIPEATSATAGNYDVVITGSSGYTCPSIQSAVASLIVNPTPNVVATNSAQTICSGNAITTMAFSGSVASTVYNWTRDNSGTVTGIGDSGTGNISGSLTSTSNAPVTVTFTITPTANSCPGTPITATVIVNPKPNAVATNSAQTICSGSAITTIGSSGNVASTTFNWARDNTGTVTGIGASGSGDINGSLTNTTSAPVTVTFTITPTANSCPGTPITATVLVNPTPNVVATNSAQTICSGNAITTMAFSGSVASTVYNWTRDNTGTVTGIGASGTGNNISGNLTNTTTAPVTVTFTLTPTANSCTGSSITATVIVNPKPNVVATNSAQTICSGIAITSIGLSGNVASSTFSWTRDNTTLVTGIPNGTGNNISGSLTNTTNAPVTVTFTITPTANSCPGSPITATVIVNPTPIAVATNSAQTICSGSAISSIALSGNVTSSTFSWTRDNTGTVTGIGASGTGNNIAGSLTNTTNAPVTVTFTITPTANSCPGTPITATVVVKPTPIASATNSAQTICSGSAITSIALSGNVTSSTFSWTRDNTTSVTGIPNGTGNNITGSLTNTTNAPVTVTFTITPTANSCPGSPITATIIVNPTPNVSQPSSQVVCNNAPTASINFITTNTGGTSTYSWTNTNPSIGLASSGTGNIPSFTATNSGTSPVTATIVVTPTFNNGSINCSGSTKTFTIIVNPDSTISLSSPVGTDACINNAMTPIKYAIGGGGTGASITSGTLPSGLTGVYSAGFFTISGTPTVIGTFNYTLTTSGACSNVALSGVIKVDPLPVGGILTFQGFGRIIDLCSNPDPGYNVPLSLSGESGTVVRWRYRQSSATSWSTVLVAPNNQIFTGKTLTAQMIKDLRLNESTIFEVEIRNGSCSPNVFSQNATLSIISQKIAPTPVTITPAVSCAGDLITLTSSTGYGNGADVTGGSFDNANSLTNEGWRVRRDGSTTDLDFPANGNTTRPNIWSNTNDKPFYTANLDGSGGSDQIWDSGDKKFAIVAGNNPSTIETPVFNTYAMESGFITFDQAYNLTAGSSIRVEISTDGGLTYQSKALYEIIGNAASGKINSFGTSSDPKNKISLDLTEYLGQGNIRIRFHFIGKLDGDVWAIDAIKLPGGPSGVTSVWTDYTNPTSPVTIGSSSVVTYTPKLIGWNDFEIRTKLTFDSSGAACPVVENFKTIRAFVFDKYTSTATANGGSCGFENVQLSGKILNSKQVEITSFPTLDGYITEWKVTGPTGYTFLPSHFSNVNASLQPINDPNAIFNPGVDGTFKLTWTLTPTLKDASGKLIENTGCPPVLNFVDVVIKNCNAIDFDAVNDYVDIGDGYTGNYSIEAWIRPFKRINADNTETNPTIGTVISTPQLNINMSDLIIAGVKPNDRWYHIAVDLAGKLYIDGIDSEKSIAKTSPVTSTRAFIGAKWTSPNPTNFFSGWIEEVRIWNGNISQDQIRFLMNQRLQPGANIGVEVPMLAPGLAYGSLAGYYQLLADPAKILNGGYTIDLANSVVNGKLRNMTTFQENTAPLPYTSRIDGQTWGTDDTWTNFNVWDAPNSKGFNDTPIDWNIVRTSHNITSGGKDITVLGLKSEVVDKKLTIESPGFSGLAENNPGQMIRVTHYLKLDGNIDLVGESQLLQDQGSILEETSKGWLERDQQGTLSSFNYNYWTSPVSVQGAANNSGFTMRSVLWDGTDSNSPIAINYQPGYPAADGAKTNPITKSDYWIFKFDNRTADDYDSWQHIGSTGSLKTGEGHTMKGVSGLGGVAAITQSQNYVYRGKPNNGNITLTIDKERNYLVGNPYPSAIDSKKFILDNLNSTTVNGATNIKNIFDGTLYFWDHFSGATHVLREYIGGYAVLNLTGGAPAIATDDRINSTAGVSTKTPEQFIPVSQGFFVNTGTEENISGGVSFTLDGGPITFKNSQRVFSRESSGNSIFLKPENITKTGKEETKSVTPKIRISFKSPKGYNRQLLVGSDPNTTNGFDLGYDALMIEYNVEDMYWIQDNNWLVIQGVPDFGKEQVLPLGIRIEKAGDFTIKIDTLENLNADHTIYLKDKLLDTIHDIKSGPYKSTSVEGEITDRFQLIFYKEKSTPDPDPIGGDPVVDVPVDPIIIDDLTEISLLHSYTENEMMVLNPKELKISAIYLFDMNGKLLEVFDEIPSEKEIRLKVNNFSDGIYVLKMHTDTQIITRKIVIKK